MHPDNTDQHFIRLLEQNRGLLYKVGRTYTRNTADLEDLVQEIIYQLWRSWSKYDAGRKYSTWMYRIALNVAISYYRSRKKQAPMETMEELAGETGATVPDAWQSEEPVDKLYAAIGRLKDLDKALLLLYLDERPQKEIAEITGLTETNVSTRIQRAKEKLKKELQ